MKRQKTVFTTSEIVHVWAHQAQTSGRTANRKESGAYSWSTSYGGGTSMMFEGAIIYSYGHHYPMAQIVNHGKDSCYVLINSEKSTVSTERHKSDVRSAVNQYPRLEVPYVDSNMMNKAEAKEAHQLNLAWLNQQTKEAHEAYLKAAKPHKYTKLQAYQRVWQKAHEYKRVTKCAGKVLEPLDSFQLERALIDTNAAHAEYQSKIDVAARERRELNSALWSLDRQARKAIEAMPSKERKAWYEANKESLHAAAELKRKEREEENAKRQAEQIQEWRNGGYSYGLHNVPTMLRISRDKTEIETSRGARFPVEHALKAYPLLRRVLENNAPHAHEYPGVMSWAKENNNIKSMGYSCVLWQTNGHSIHLGHYKIDRIMCDGTIYAGCHIVSWSEVERCWLELQQIEASNNQS